MTNPRWLQATLRQRLTGPFYQFLLSMNCSYLRVSKHCGLTSLTLQDSITSNIVVSGVKYHNLA